MDLATIIRMSTNSLFILIVVVLGLIFIPVPPNLGTKILAAVLLAVGLAIDCYHCMKLARLAYTRLMQGLPYAAFTALYFLSTFAAGAILLYSLCYKMLGLVDGAGKEISNPADFIYFSIVTWTTLGYGDLQPTPFCRLFAASEALFGYVFMGLYVSILFYVISRPTAPAPQTSRRLGRVSGNKDR